MKMIELGRYHEYSYVPIDKENGTGYVESNERVVIFRNQYGERHVLIPLNIRSKSMIFMFIFGVLAGVILGKVIF